MQQFDATATQLLRYSPKLSHSRKIGHLRNKSWNYFGGWPSRILNFTHIAGPSDALLLFRNNFMEKLHKVPYIRVVASCLVAHQCVLHLFRFVCVCISLNFPKAKTIRSDRSTKKTHKSSSVDFSDDRYNVCHMLTLLLFAFVSHIFHVGTQTTNLPAIHFGVLFSLFSFSVLIFFAFAFRSYAIY